MFFLKIGLVLSAILLFIVACNQTNTTNTTTTANTVAVTNANAAAETSPAAAKDELVSARKTYSEICINCHKEGGKGGISTIEGKKIKAPDFTSDRFKKDDENDWIKTIHNGAVEDGMPAFKDKLSDDQIKGLVKLIRKDFQGM